MLVVGVIVRGKIDMLFFLRGVYYLMTEMYLTIIIKIIFVSFMKNKCMCCVSIKRGFGLV